MSSSFASSSSLSTLTRRSALPLVLVSIAALAGAACGSSGAASSATTGTSGSGGNAGSGGSGSGGSGGAGVTAQSYEPKGCSFTIAPRAEYVDFTVGKTDVGATPNIRRVRLGVGGNVAAGAAGHADPSTSIGVAWETDEGTLASEIQWGTDPDPSKWPTENRASGATWQTPPAGVGGTGPERMHEVYLCGLSPATTYSYRVGGGAPGKEVWSDVHHFATTPAGASTPVKIGVAGDARGEAGDAWHLIQKRFKSAGAGLQIFSGDVANLGQDQAAWEHWLDSAATDSGQPLTLGEMVLLATHGNHENHTSLYYGNFVLPQEHATFPQYDELFFSMDIGAVHFVVIDDSWIANDSEDGAYADTVAKWLEADLAAADANRAKVPWIVTMQHRSEFSSSNHGDDSDVIRTRKFLVPIWDKHHVDLAMRGHDHNYERSKPVKGPLAGDANLPVVGATPADGTIYVVCAGAGAPSYGNGTSTFTETSWAFTDASSLGVYGFLDADATKLTFTAHELRADATDPVIDTFTITK